MNHNRVLILVSAVLVIIIGGLFLIQEFIPPSQEETSNGNTNSRSYIVVDTAQNICFNSNEEIVFPSFGERFYGQDAQYDGLEIKYADNGDGTISDLNTGLMWQKDAGEKMTYSQAVTGVSTFSLAGYSDWRLPTIKELYSLIDFRGIDPSGGASSGMIPFIDTDYFDFEYGDASKGERLIDSQWTTNSVYKSTVMGGQEGFFGVNFADGRIKCYPTADFKLYFTKYVRGSSYGLNNFVDNGDGTIIDLNTGLMWQKDDSGRGMLWEDSLDYAENF
jgi:hypothetical protein